MFGPITDDAKFDRLVKVVYVGFLYCKSIFSLCNHQGTCDTMQIFVS